jgi:hypothetical protein
MFTVEIYITALTAQVGYVRQFSVQMMAWFQLHR